MKISNLFRRSQSDFCFDKMNQNNSQKQVLLSSMQKLIHYIQLSKENQWEIFESLSKKDITKIISNLEDNDPKIRKLSLCLLGSLLNNNNTLKTRLCQRMEITLIPGKICLNYNSISKTNLKSQKIKSLIFLLKQSVKKQDQIFPIWMINLRKDVLKIDFIPFYTLNFIDPNDHLIGFTLLEENKQNPRTAFLSLFSSSSQQIRSPKKQLNKPIFVVKPMTQRSSSPSTEISNRFNRTTNNKTSLKYNLKRSLMENRTEIREKICQNNNQREILSNPKFRSEKTSPNKGFYTQRQGKTQISEFMVSESSQKYRTNNDTFRQERNMAHTIVNRTNIYINGLHGDITIQNGKVKIKKTLCDRQRENIKTHSDQFKDNNNQWNQQGLEKEQNQNNISINCLCHSINNECNIFVQPFKKYERKTLKQQTVNEKRQFDLDKCRQFLKKVTLSVNKKTQNQLK